MTLHDVILRCCKSSCGFNTDGTASFIQPDVLCDLPEDETMDVWPKVFKGGAVLPARAGFANSSTGIAHRPLLAEKCLLQLKDSYQDSFDI